MRANVILPSITTTAGVGNSFLQGATGEIWVVLEGQANNKYDIIQLNFLLR